MTTIFRGAIPLLAAALALVTTGSKAVAAAAPPQDSAYAVLGGSMVTSGGPSTVTEGPGISRGSSTAQSTGTLTLIPGLGLPAVDAGALVGEHQVVNTPARQSSGALGAAIAAEARGVRSGPAYAAGRLLVRFRDGALGIGESLRGASPSAWLESRPANADFDIVGIDPGENAEAVAASLRMRDDVEYAQPAYFMHAMTVPNDPLYKQLQWNLPLIDMERAWDIQPQAGSSITVAVIDTGVAFMAATITTNILAFRDSAGNRYPSIANANIPYSAAPQLAAPGRFVAPHDFVNDTNTPLDFDGHGTHVSGTIGQLTNDGIGTAGVAYNVKLMPLKVICGNWDVLFGTPVSRCGTDEQVAQAIRYAADNGARVINMSIGRESPSTCAANRNQAGCAPAIEDAMNYAVGKGVFIAIAAGNSFLEENPTQTPAEIASRVQGAVSVAAVDLNMKHAAYSSTGAWVELAAPGGGGGHQRPGLRVAADLPSKLHRHVRSASGPVRGPAVRCDGVRRL